MGSVIQGKGALPKVDGSLPPRLPWKTPWPGHSLTVTPPQNISDGCMTVVLSNATSNRTQGHVYERTNLHSDGRRAHSFEHGALVRVLHLQDRRCPVNRRRNDREPNYHALVLFGAMGVSAIAWGVALVKLVEWVNA